MRVATFSVGAGPTGLAYVAGAIWVADEQGGSLVRLNPATGAVLSTVPLGQNRKPHALTYDGASLWVDFSDGADLVQMDSATGAFLSNRTAQFGSGDMLYDGRFLWITSPISRTKFV